MKSIWLNALLGQRIMSRLIACAFIVVLFSHFAARSAQAAGVVPAGPDEPTPMAGRQKLSTPKSITDVASFSVFAPLVQTPATSSQLIYEAMQRGEIDEETGLVYQVFAAHGDTRLPVRYRGDDTEVIDTMIMAEVELRFGSLSAETQATLAPFLLSPADPGSWLELREDGVQGHTQSALPAALIWGRELAANGQAWFWYLTKNPGDAVKAQAMATELSARIWPALTAKMGGRVPLPDTGKPGGGVDGRLDIYLVPLGNMGEAHRFPPYCKGVPSRILLKRTLPSPVMEAVLAHEFMHVLTNSYAPNGHCVYPGEYAWLTEATGKWAEEVVYPDLNWDAEWPSAGHFLRAPKLPLEKDPSVSPPHYRWYGAYLWLFYLDNTDLSNPVNKIWVNSESASDSLDAIHRSIDGGFAKQWPIFTLYNWNAEPVDYYDFWDPGFPYSIYHFANTVDERDISLVGLPDFAFNLNLTGGVEHLSAHYFHLKFPDDDVRTAVFYNGFTYKLSKKDVTANGLPFGIQRVATTLSDADREGRNVRALVKINGKPWQEENWTGKPIVSYCRDKKDERIEEIVLVFSNSDHSNRTRKLEPLDLPPALWASNMGCWKWTGTAEYNFTHPNGVSDLANAEITWTRPAAFGTSAVNDEFTLRSTGFRVQGTVNWIVSGYNTSNDCHYNGSGTTGLSGSLSLYNFTVEGPRHRAYRGDAGLNQPWVEVRLTCDDGSNQTDDYPIIFPVFTTWDLNDLWAVKTIDPSGAKMKDEFQNYLGSTATIKWDFKAERE